MSFSNPHQKQEEKKIDLPQSLKARTEDILADCQANIFKPHARRYVFYLIVKWSDELVKHRLRELLQRFALGPLGGSTGLKQLEDARAFRKKREKDGGILTNIFISGLGMERILDEHTLALEDHSFKMGMTKQGQDEPPESWDENWAKRKSRDNHRKTATLPDALLMLAGNDRDALNDRADLLKQELEREGLGSVVFTEIGERIGADGKSYEPFGYRDGMSQPLFWSRNRSQLLYRNRPLVLDKERGSYVVFLKMEQDVPAFDKAVDEITVNLYYTDPEFREKSLAQIKSLPTYAGHKELVEAQIMGRAKDGTPLPLIVKKLKGTKFRKSEEKEFDLFDVPSEKNIHPVPNPFDIGCPLHSHIRKVNPRNGDDIRKMSKLYKGEVKQRLRIVRRSIPYSEKEAETGTEKRGLLFLSFQASISFQYLTIIREWVDKESFPFDSQNPIPTGVDPIIGRAWNINHESSYTWYEDFATGKTRTIPYNFQNLVTVRGGEFFYAPSRTWFAKLLP